MTSCAVADAADELPTPHELSLAQTERALNRLKLDSSLFPRFDIPSLHALSGPFAPQELVLIGGDTGAGKSLFAHNLIEMLLAQRVPSLVLGTEQSTEILRIKHACVMARVPFKLILKPEDDEIGSPRQIEAMAKIQKALFNLHIDDDYICWAEEEYIDRRALEKWVTWGVRHLGIRVAVVDHVHQMDHGSGQNTVAELTATVQLAGHLAKRYNITIFLFAQIKRRHITSALDAYKPPAKEDFAGASALERNSSLIFGIWRPLRQDMSIKELQAIKEKASYGLIGDDTLYEPNTMGVKLLKDRLGDVFGKQTLLHVERNRLEERVLRHLHGTSYDELRNI